MRPKTASSRSFGFLVAAVLALIGGLDYWAGRERFVPWLAAAGVFLAVALAMPRLLLPLKRLWLKLGRILHVVTSPIIVGVLYLSSIVPVGLLARLFGADLLSMKRDAAAATYWIKRDPPGPAPDSLRKQF
jgi:hypothetical protein